MIDINKEAEEYAKKMWGVYFDDKHPDVGIEQTQGEISIEDFIAGAKSKHVQAKILQAQIDVLKEVYSNLFATDKKFWISQQDEFDIKILLLQQQLKQLENEIQ